MTYISMGSMAPAGSFYTVSSDGTQTVNTTAVALGASTNHSISNFSNGSYTIGWGSTLTGLTSIQKVSMSLNGQYQYAVQNGSSTINHSVNSGITWGSLTGANGLPAGNPSYSSVSVSATGQYILASVNGGLLYTCANGTSSIPTFNATVVGTPTYYLPLENSVSDTVGSSAPTVTGSVTYRAGIAGSFAAIISNTAGGTPSNFIRSGTIPALTNFIISGWINVQSIPASGSISAIVTLGTASNTVVTVSYCNNAPVGSNTYNGIIFSFYSSANVIVGNLTTVSLNTWYNFTYIFSTTGTCYVYVNNTLLGSATGATLLANPTRYTIGSASHISAQAFNGYIDDLRIYNSNVPLNWVQTAVSGTGQYMLATATGGGLFMSSNYGTTWTQVVNVSGWTGLAISYSGQYMVAVSTVSTYAPYYSTNYGVTWTNTTFGGLTSAFVAISGNGQYSLTGWTTNVQLISNYLAGYSTTTYTIPTFSPSLAANINCADISATGQYMTILTVGTTNNLYYSTNYGSSFTGMTVGSAAMTDCAISADGSYITVSNATTVYTLNLNTRGYTVAVGNAAGLLNQGLNAIAIGNQAGANNQSAGSIVINSSGAPLDAYNSGLYVSNVSDYRTSYSPSFSLLGYGADKQVVQGSAITLMPTGSVGIGTAAPAGTLHIHNSNASFTGAPTVIIGDGQVDAGGTYGMLQLVRANDGADNKAHLSFIKNGLTIFGMGYYPGASQSAFGLVPSFGTMATNTGLWMTTGGNVGIGTSSPSYLLHVYGNVNSGVEQYFQNANSGSSAYTLIGCRNNTPSQLVLFLNSSTRTADGGTSTATIRNDAGALRLQSSTGATSGNIFIAATSGYVGIGNSAPLCRLYVQGTETTGWAGMSYFGGTNWGFVCGQYDANNVYAGAHNAALNTWGNIILCAGGNCGIGVAPSYKLHVSGTSYLAGEVYGTNWFRVVGSGGVWWESYSRGIRAADSESATYGNITTHGVGINTWNGYDIFGRYTFMANGDTFGLHDRNYTWAFRSVNGTSYFDRPLVCNSTTTCSGEFYSSGWVRINDNNSGVYWQNLGRGIASNSNYGNITTYGTGAGNWNGYNISGRYNLMANTGSTSWGLYDSSYGWLMQFNGINCGIGLDNAIYPLTIQRGFNTGSSTYYIGGGYLNTSGGYHFGYQGAAYTVSFVCSNQIITADSVGCQGVNNYSDIRIKTNVKSFERSACDLINQLRIVSYDYIDYKKGSCGAGVIGQEIQEVFPECIKIQSHFIPNIYCRGTHTISNDIITINYVDLDGNPNIRDHPDIIKAKKIILQVTHNDSEQRQDCDIININSSCCTVKKWSDYSVNDKIFVYGVEIDDFVHVDKNMISMLNVKATQELAEANAAQAQKIESLTAEVADLKEKLALVMAKLGM